MVMMGIPGSEHTEGVCFRRKAWVQVPLPWCLFLQVPADVMAWPWLSCLLLPVLVVSGGCRLSPTRTALTWGSSAEPSSKEGIPQQ